MLDLSKPSHMTACLKTFQHTIGASNDHWDAAFQEQWDSADLMDCILSYAATRIVDMLAAKHADEAAALDAGKMLEKLK